MIFFSAHGVPLAYVEEAGDPYKAEMEECIDLIMEELEKRGITNPCILAYQVNADLLTSLAKYGGFSSFTNRSSESTEPSWTSGMAETVH
jgi:GH25 family lysozyme M1 (1,4-beta-N-acetylmuramidase)